jgi:exodeoxyribonuclease-3
MGKQDADMVCVQELKAQEADMTEAFLAPHGYHGYFHYAEKRATAAWAVHRHKPERVITASATRSSTPKAAMSRCSIRTLP